MDAPKIFISYAHADLKAAETIASALARANLKAFFDLNSLSPGQNWIAAIQEALSKAGYLVALISTASLKSVWVQQEWTAMLSRQLKGTGGGVVVPLRLEDVEPPLLLSTLQRIDLFPDFDAGVASLVGFLLSETQPAGLVQQKVKSTGRTSDLRPEAFFGVQAGSRFSTATWKIWHDNITDHERVTDAVLSKLDKRTIRLTALRCVVKADLDAFCFDANIDPGAIGGGTLNETILSLLQQLLRDDRLDEFLSWLAEEKPPCVRAAIRAYMPESPR